MDREDASAGRPKPLYKKLLGPPYRQGLRLLARLRPSRVGDLFRWLAFEVSELSRRRNDPRLTVAVDINPFWEPLTGIGWYLHRLLDELAERDDLALRLYGPNLVPSPDLPAPTVRLPSGRAIEVVAFRPPEGTIVPQGWLIRLLRRLGPILVAFDRNRVLFAPNFFLPNRFLLARGHGALVATVHDLAFRHLAWTLDERTLLDLEERLDRTAFEAVHLITPSEAVRRELVASGLAGAQRVTAIHHGPGQQVATADSPTPAGLPERYVLFVGTLEPRKNLETLLAAWRHRALAGPTAPKLVLCGKLGWKSEKLSEEIRRGESEGWLVALGYVSAAALGEVYRRALVFAFPSRYEGFGLPLLEAAAAGVPLLTSDIPVLREVCGDAAHYAATEDPDAWALGIRKIADDPALRSELGLRARRRAEDFSWARSAAEHARVFHLSGWGRA
jgi:glycosyltransferase involved in cell wall biosynthesis